MISTAEIKKRFYIGAFFRGFIIYYAIEKLFYLDNGLSLQSAVLIGIFAWVPQILFEIPSSTLADRWNRRKVIVIGCFGIMLSTFMVVNSHTLIEFIISVTVWSLSVSFISGTTEALLYDLLKNNGDHKDYQQAQFRARSSFLLGVFVSGLAAYAMVSADLPLSYTYWASLPFNLLALVLVYYIPEAKISRTSHINLTWYKHLGSAAKDLKSQAIRWLGLVLSVTISLRSILYEYHQLVGLDKGLSYSQVALLFSSILLAITLTSFFFSKVVLSHRIVSLIWAGLLISAVFGMQLNGFVAVTLNLVIIYICIEFIEQYIQLDLQHRIQSSKRATILSLASAAGQVGFLILAALFVFLIDSLGASFLTTLASLPLLALGFIEVARFKKRRKAVLQNG